MYCNICFWVSLHSYAIASSTCVGKITEGNQQDIVTWSISERGSPGADSGQVSSGRPWRKVITSVPLTAKSFGP